MSEAGSAAEWAANFGALADLAQVSGKQTTERAMSNMKIEGLGLAEEVRREDAWWEFWSEHSQVTDLMNNYYKDVLCAFPADRGHRWYQAQADQYSLGEALDHTQGFYATIKSRVPIEGGNEPARPSSATAGSATPTSPWQRRSTPICGCAVTAPSCRARPTAITAGR